MQPLITSVILSIMSQSDYLCQLQVFQRERRNGHQGVIAFVISNTLSAMPFLILITFLSGTICYFMVRLHPGFWHYLTVVESLMMAIASIVPKFLMGIIIGAGIQVCTSPYSKHMHIELYLPKSMLSLISCKPPSIIQHFSFFFSFFGSSIYITVNQ